MADKLKDYIQKSRELLDRDEPRLEFRESLLEQLNKRSQQKKTWATAILFRRLAIAASLCLLIVCAFLMWKDEPPVANEWASNSESFKQEASGGHVSVDQTNNTPAPNIKEVSPLQETGFSKNKPTVKKYSNLTNVSFVDYNTSQGVSEDSPQKVNIEHLSQTANQPNISVEEPSVAEQTPITLPQNTETAPVLLPSVTDANTQPSLSNETLQNRPGTELAAVTEAEEVQNVGSFIKKGVLGFLKKKAKQISKNAIDFQSDDSKEPTALALHFKSDLIEVQKTIPLNREND